MTQEEAAREKNADNAEWQGSPLQMWEGMDPYGIKEIALHFDTGDEEVLKPRVRDEFRSYELHQAATYLDSIAGQLHTHRK